MVGEEPADVFFVAAEEPNSKNEAHVGDFRSLAEVADRFFLAQYDEK
jgi:hypothetical protein